jgi:hypothetical protein
MQKIYDSGKARPAGEAAEELATLLSGLSAAPAARKWSVKEATAARIRPGSTVPSRPASLSGSPWIKRIRTLDDVRIRLTEEQLAEFRGLMLAAFDKVSRTSLQTLPPEPPLCCFLVGLLC